MLKHLLLLFQIFQKTKCHVFLLHLAITCQLCGVFRFILQFTWEFYPIKKLLCKLKTVLNETNLIILMKISQNEHFTRPYSWEERCCMNHVLFCFTNHVLFFAWCYIIVCLMMLYIYMYNSVFCLSNNMPCWIIMYCFYCSVCTVFLQSKII